MSRKMLINFFLIFIPFTLLFLLFAFTKIELMKDYFHLNGIKDSSRFIATILGTLATIISITVALVILSFNTFKQKAGEYAIEYFVNIKPLHYLVSLYFTVILLVFFSFIQVSKDTNHNSINLLYFNIYLFIITIISMIVFSYKLFKQISMSELIKYYFLRITKNEITEFKKKNLLGFQSLERNLKSPTFILEDLGLTYLRKGDFVISNLIYAELTNKIINYIGEEKDDKNLNQYLEYLFKIYKNSIPEAISKSNHVLLSDIWYWCEQVHCVISTSVNRSLIFWSHFHFFGLEYYKTLVKSNHQELADKFLDTVFQLFNLDKNKIFPHEKEISVFNYLYKEGYKELYGECIDDNSLEMINKDWGDFIELIKEIYYLCGEFNLKINNEIGLLNTIQRITKITVFQNSASQPLKDLYVFKTFYPLIREFLNRGIERKIFNGDIDEVSWNINPLRKLIHHEKILYENNILVEYCNLLIFLQKHNLIGFPIVGGLTLGDITFTGELGELIQRYIYSYKKDESSLDCLKTIVDTIEIIKDGFEKNLKNYNGFHFRLRERLINIEEELNKNDVLSDKGVHLLNQVKTLVQNMNTVREKNDNSIIIHKDESLN